MTIKSTNEENTQNEVVDDISTEEVKKNNSEEIDMAKLAALKARSQMKKEENNKMAKLVSKKEKSLRLGVVGTGQAGSRLAQSFYELGYDAVAMNTAMQDLQPIAIPDSNKLLLEGTLGGAGKERSIGAAAAEGNRDKIADLIRDKLGSSQVIVLCSSLGGGSGSGSLETILSVLNDVGKPVICLCALPLESDDVQTKYNALESLSELAKHTKDKTISNLIVVDNSKLEALYSKHSQRDFYSVSNKAVVEPLDIFNTFSSQITELTKALDSTEFAKLLIDSEGLSVFGSMTVANWDDEMALAQAVMENLNNNLLATDFDVTQSKYAGFMLVANKKVWDSMPTSSVNYANALLIETAKNPKSIFRGCYVADMDEDVVKVYSWFAGLGVPSKRIALLKEQVDAQMKDSKNKEENRNLNLSVDIGKVETSAAQKVRDKITSGSSKFGRLAGMMDKKIGK